MKKKKKKREGSKPLQLNSPNAIMLRTFGVQVRKSDPSSRSPYLSPREPAPCLAPAPVGIGDDDHRRGVGEEGLGLQNKEPKCPKY